MSLRLRANKRKKPRNRTSSSHSVIRNASIASIEGAEASRDRNEGCDKQCNAIRFPPIKNGPAVHLTVPGGVPAGVQFAWDPRPHINAYVVTGLQPGSVGDICGRIQAGMVLMSVDGESLAGLGITEQIAMNKMIAASQLTRTLSFLPQRPPPAPSSGFGQSQTGILPPATELLGIALRRKSLELQRKQQEMAMQSQMTNQPMTTKPPKPRIKGSKGPENFGPTSTMMQKNLQEIADEWWNDPYSTPARRRRIYNEIAKEIWKGYQKKICKRVLRWRLEDRASTLIQAKYRSFCTRRWYVKTQAMRQDHAARQLQRVGRGLIGRRKAHQRQEMLLHILKTKSAVMLQKIFRRRLASARVAILKQRREELLKKKQDVGATNLQRIIRGRKDRQRFVAVKIQREKEISCAIQIQAILRASRSRAIVDDLRRKEQSALILQNFWLKSERRKNWKRSCYAKQAIFNATISWWSKLQEAKLAKQIQENEAALEQEVSRLRCHSTGKSADFGTKRSESIGEEHEDTLRRCSSNPIKLHQVQNMQVKLDGSGRENTIQTTFIELTYEVEEQLMKSFGNMKTIEKDRELKHGQSIKVDQTAGGALAHIITDLFASDGELDPTKKVVSKKHVNLSEAANEESATEVPQRYMVLLECEDCGARFLARAVDSLLPSSRRGPGNRGAKYICTNCSRACAGLAVQSVAVTEMNTSGLTSFFEAMGLEEESDHHESDDGSESSGTSSHEPTQEEMAFLERARNIRHTSEMARRRSSSHRQPAIRQNQNHSHLESQFDCTMLITEIIHDLMSFSVEHALQRTFATRVIQVRFRKHRSSVRHHAIECISKFWVNCKRRTKKTQIKTWREQAIKIQSCFRKHRARQKVVALRRQCIGALHRRLANFLKQKPLDMSNTRRSSENKELDFFSKNSTSSSINNGFLLSALVNSKIPVGCPSEELQHVDAIDKLCLHF